MSRLFFQGLIITTAMGLMSVSATAQQPSPTTPANPPMQTTPPATTQTPGAMTPRTPPATSAAPMQPAAPTTGASYSDVQLRSFAAASRQIQPLNAQMTSGTPEQRTAAVTQVRTILQQNNLDSATYNAIAARAQSDRTFASRIASLSPSSSPG